MLSVLPPDLQAAAIAVAAHLGSARRTLAGHAGPIGAVSVALLVGALVLVGGTGGVATAEAATAASKRNDARVLLAPMKRFDRSVERRWAGLARQGEAWASGVVPCVRAAYGEITQRRDAGALSRRDATTVGQIVSSVSFVDAAQAMSGPLRAELARAQRAYKRAGIRDRVLRAGARGKAREIGALRALGDVDTCSFAREWEQRGFSLAAIPDFGPGMSVEHELGGAKATRQVGRAAKRLRKHGVSRGRAEAFEMFPLVSLVAPAFQPALLPPM